MRKLHIELSTLERVRLWAEIIALFAAGVWAIYTFVYQTQVAPLLEPPHVVVATEIVRVGETSDSYVERARVTLTNDGHASVDVAGYAISVFGIRNAVPAAFSQTRHNGTTISAFFSNVPERGLPVLASDGGLNSGAQNGPLHSHIVLRGNDTAQLDVLFFAPKGRYSALKADTQLVYVRYPYADTVPVELVRDTGGALMLTSRNKDRAFAVRVTSYFGV